MLDDCKIWKRLSRFERFSAPSLKVGESAPTARVCQMAYPLFYGEVAAQCGRYKMESKYMYFSRLLRAGLGAVQIDGTVRVSLNNNNTSSAEKQVIDAAVSIGLFEMEKSCRGGVNQTRLLPTKHIAQLISSDDPFEYEQPPTYFVSMRKRNKERKIISIPFDRKHLVAQESQLKLESINRVNSGSTITWPAIENLIQML